MMGKCCCAVGCSNKFFKGCGLQFYRFPADTEKRNRWIAAVSRSNWQPTEYTWICSCHFVGGRKSNDPTSPAYIPTLFKHKTKTIKRKAECHLARHERAIKRKRLQALAGTDQQSKSTASNMTTLPDCSSLYNADHGQQSSSQFDLDLHSNSVSHNAVSVLTEMPLSDCSFMNDDNHSQQPSSLSDIDLQSNSSTHSTVSVTTEMSLETIRGLELECNVLRQENIQLQKELESLKNRGFLENSKKVCYYTGLPSLKILNAVFDFVAPHVPNTRSSISPFQQFLMVLIKLRLNLDYELLSMLFHVHPSTICRYFNKWIDVMYQRLKPLVMWPDHEQLHKTMPMEFIRNNFSNCVVIIDCFEIFMERPKRLMARAQTWSNYKHHNTVKFLIGISPQGSITFVSKGWGGRVSDKYLTENCGIFDNLLPGDIVLADRGFNVHDEVRLYCAEVKLPPFTNGKKQLSNCEVDKARQLSRLRIHVERVIGFLRLKYKILRSTLPINLIMCRDGDDHSTIDKIVTICSALCNCCESVVPFN